MAVELSGGQFLPPVQTLVATIIFTKGENAIRVPSGVPYNTNLKPVQIKIVDLEKNGNFEAM